MTTISSPAAHTHRPAVARPAADRLTGLALIAGPTLMTGYGLLRLLHSSRTPGLGWTGGHLMLLGGFLCFARVFWALGRLLATQTTGRRIVARLVTGISYAGLFGGLGQVSIDLYAGTREHTVAGMNHVFSQVQSQPGVLPAFYTVLPIFFFVGVVLFTLMLAILKPRHLPFWSPVVAHLAIAAAMLGLNFLPLATVCMLLALAPLARKLTQS